MTDCNQQRQSRKDGGRSEPERFHRHDESQEQRDPGNQRHHSGGDVSAADFLGAIVPNHDQFADEPEEGMLYAP